jgi:hypothetical protein
MHKLRRMHLDSIGSNAARFRELTLDFTDPEGSALDTIVWLRNGGGKTSLLALYFSLVLPNRTDFLGAQSDKKTLGDYVLSGDTAHFVCEWDTPHGPLVTGAVYEWPDRHRPLDHETHATDLVRRWYAFNPKLGVLGLDQRPLRDEHGRRRNLESFIRELRALGKAHPLTGLVVASTSAEWKHVLEARGIDPAVFKYQKRMNKGEGAIDEEFRFASGNEFVEFLIDMTVDAEASKSLSDRIRLQADKLARRPETETELAYCEGVAGRLEPIASVWSDLERYRSELDTATASARRLATGLHLAHDVAAVAETSAEERRIEANARRTASETSRTTAREKGREFRRLAVEFWVQDAIARIEKLETQRLDAEAEQSGWAALEDLFELERIEGELTEIDRRLSAKATAAEPLRLARNAAARRLHWRYVTQVDEAAAERDAALSAEADGRADAARLSIEAQEAGRAAGRFETQIATVRAELTKIAEALSEAVAAGHLGVADEPDVALAGAEHAAADAAAKLARLEAEIAAATQRQNTVVADRTAVGSEINTISAARDELETERSRLAAEAADLATNERVRELAQSDVVSLWGAAGALEVRLGEEIERADAALIAEGVSADRDRRNRAALGEGGLLPASDDTVAMIEVLSAAGITGVAGLSYLSASVARRDWDATMAAHPGLLSGVLVDAGDFEQATEALIEAGLHPSSLVTVAKKSDLRSEGEGAFVVPPSPALYDKEKADEERKRLDQRLGELDGRLALLVAGRDADRVLRDRLLRFMEVCPHGHIEGLARHIADHETTLETFVHRQEALEVEADEIATLLATSGTRRAALAQEQLEARDAIAVLRPLAREVGRRPELEAAETLANEQFAAANELETSASAAATPARSIAEECHGTAMASTARISTLTKRLSQIDLRAPGSWDDETDQRPGIPTEALENDLAARDEEYSGKVSDPVLEDRRLRLSEERTRAQGTLAGRGDSAFRRATELRQRADALDADLRARRKRELTETHATLLAQGGEAAGDRKLAERELAKLPLRDDRNVLRKLDDDEQPVDRADAERRAAGAEAEAQRHQATTTEAALAVTEATSERDAAKTRKHLVLVLAEGLDNVAPAAHEHWSGAVEAFEGSDDEARTIQGEVTASVRAATTKFTDAERRLSDLVGALRRFAGQAVYDAAGSMREAILVGEVDDVSRRAHELAKQHRVRGDVLRNDLDAISADQEILVTDLAGQVRRVLDLLKKAPATSKMDKSLGDWGGKSFLTVNFDDVTAHPDELARRVSAEVDAIVAKGLVPDGLATLKRAVLAAVPAGFKVRVLKPTPDLREERVSVSAMAKWSGGEKLTAAVVLYCIIARLRTKNTARDMLSDSSGALVLDNPLGKASYVGFLDMQRRVAEALGVQLLYTTAVRDLRAVGTFPNVIRCRNVAPASGDRGYVTVSGRAGEGHGTPIDGMVSSARVVRLDDRATNGPAAGDEDPVDSAAPTDHVVA